MTPDETITELKRQMYSASVTEESKALVGLLQDLKSAVRSDHAFCLAMAILVGIECATNEAIPEDQRREQLKSMTGLTRTAFARASRRRA
jgi:hypothetical protein